MNAPPTIWLLCIITEEQKNYIQWKDVYSVPRDSLYKCKDPDFWAFAACSSQLHSDMGTYSNKLF